MNFGDGSNRNFTGKETNAAVVFDAISSGEDFILDNDPLITIFGFKHIPLRSTP